MTTLEYCVKVDGTIEGTNERLGKLIFYQCLLIQSFNSFNFFTSQLKVVAVWSIVRPGRPKHLDRRTARFETFGRTDYVVGT